MAAGRASNALPATVQISTQSGKTIWATQAQRCGMAYDGQLSTTALQQKVVELKDWQLRPENWPAGTNTQQLLGLRKELDDAQALLQSLPPGNYRRVRTVGPGCATQNEAFWLLADGTRLLGIVFPAQGLGAEVAEYRRLP